MDITYNLNDTQHNVAVTGKIITINNTVSFNIDDVLMIGCVTYNGSASFNTKTSMKSDYFFKIYFTIAIQRSGEILNLNIRYVRNYSGKSSLIKDPKTLILLNEESKEKFKDIYDIQNNILEEWRKNNSKNLISIP